MTPHLHSAINISLHSPYCILVQLAFSLYQPILCFWFIQSKPQTWAPFIPLVGWTMTPSDGEVLIPRTCECDLYWKMIQYGRGHLGGHWPTWLPLKGGGLPWLVWLSWLEHHPAAWRVPGSIGSQGTCPGWGFNPQSGCIREGNQSMFLSLPLSSPSSLCDEKMSRGEDKSK